MLIIGITGGTGSGKTTALGAVERLGGTVIDCDELYHRLLEENTAMLAEIQARFPEAFIDSKLDRKKLGETVFSDPEALKELNGITHRYVDIEVNRALGHARTEGRPLAAVDAIALIESGLGERCDITVAVTAPENDRVKRLVSREGISEQYARKRIAAQKSDEWFAENCTLVLQNSGSRDEFEKECVERFNKLLKEWS